MKNRKYNISIPLATVEKFLDAQANPGKYKPAESAQIAGELINDMKAAHTALKAGKDDPNLTVCIGRLAYVNPVDVQKLIRGEIPALTVYRRKKNTRHMGLYMKHTPSFYLQHTPAKNKTRPRKAKVKK